MLNSNNKFRLKRETQKIYSSHISEAVCFTELTILRSSEKFSNCCSWVFIYLFRWNFLDKDGCVENFGDRGRKVDG